LALWVNWVEAVEAVVVAEAEAKAEDDAISAG
jgi:hypothetical protein